ncbi:hypothetical protein ACIRRA_40785 [Nocardia sp. NPDC101769]|uniref:hypothetical protein n=1 Tax=Nocardia sp. NPDC101769 TaxID=3364333 RepID=UPI0038089596
MTAVALLRRFTALPADTFPQTRRYAAELTSGTGPDRFAFTLALILNNLCPSVSRASAPPFPAGPGKNIDALNAL